MDRAYSVGIVEPGDHRVAVAQSRVRTYFGDLPLSYLREDFVARFSFCRLHLLTGRFHWKIGCPHDMGDYAKEFWVVAPDARTGNALEKPKVANRLLTDKTHHKLPSDHEAEVVSLDMLARFATKPTRQQLVAVERKLRSLSSPLKISLALWANYMLRSFDVELVRASQIWRPLKQLEPLPKPDPMQPFSAPFLKGLQGSQIGSLQKPADFAVVMPTVLRPTITDAIQSVFDQRFGGTIQILIGVDATTNELAQVEQFCRSIPDRQSILLFYPGYSTSRRHGGLHAARDCGSLRILLSYMANSQYIAYLDDDNWWSDDHVSTMHAVLSAGAEWAYALRWFVHPGSRQPICKDEWESVGPGRGYFKGWVDPNCLAIDKIACEAVLRWWSIPRPYSAGMNADRNVFRILNTQYRGAPTNRHSVFYEITETDSMHPYRLSVIGGQRYHTAGKVL
jgi:hypothetical protein